MRWSPGIQASGTGLALVSGFAPTLGLEIPYLVRLGAVLSGLVMLAWPLTVFVFDLLRRASKMWLIAGIVVGAALCVACAIALFVGPSGKDILSSPPQEPRKFYSTQDKENLANLCTDLIGFLRDNGGDGGGNGAWKMIATLGNDWNSLGTNPPDSALLDKDLENARVSVQSFKEKLYGPSGLSKKYDAYHDELEMIFPPSQDYFGQIRTLEAAVNEFGDSIAALVSERDADSRQRLYVALRPSHDKYVKLIQEFQKQLFEATQRVETFRKQLRT